MQFSYNWLQSFFEKKLPSAEKLAEVLIMHTFEAKKGKAVTLPSGASDMLLDIDVLPNRAHDCFSHLGVAKEISALLKFPMSKNLASKPELLDQSARDFLKLEVKEPQLCRRYIAGVILGVKVGPSPAWIQDRLIAVGQKPINNIVDAANYVMFEMGQPLHAFDMDKLEVKKIIVRRAKDGEKITTLDNKEFLLDKDVLVIADSKEPLAIAGIKGGKFAEIEKKTKNLILEAANFEPVNIRLTSKKIGLITGASVGFENEISMALAESAMKRVAALIQETAGGKIVAENIDFYPQKLPVPRISFEPKDVSKHIGIAVGANEIVSILSRLGFGIRKAKGKLVAAPPEERLDIARKEDIIEEVARMRGYDKIPGNVPEVHLMPTPVNDNYFYGDAARNILTGAGFSEVYNYSFAPSGEVEIENPSSLDKKYLRTSLLNGLSGNVSHNFKYFNEVKIFEIGKVFKKTGKDIVEKNMLAAMIAGKKSGERSEEFFEIKGVVETLLFGVGISDFLFKEAGHPGKIAEIKIGDDNVGLAEKNAFEIDLGKLIFHAVEEIEYRPVSKYPAVIRDVAVLVPSKTKVIEVLDVIENEAGELLIDSDLFDIYEGEELGKDKKNLAFHLIFQSREKTLVDKGITGLIGKIIEALETNPDWEVRKGQQIV